MEVEKKERKSEKQNNEEKRECVGRDMHGGQASVKVERKIERS